jgi:hypothetical protein
MDAAYEAELVLGLAEDTPDRLDPPPGTPGARKRGWAAPNELPGVSEFFTAELSVLVNCGRGTASVLAHRAWTYRESLPRTWAALRAGQIDERRARDLADVLAHTAPEVARAVEARLLGEASSLSLRRLRARAQELLLELDAAGAHERRDQAQQAADVRIYPSPTDGMGTLAADMPVDELAACYDLVDSLARMLKADGDERPLGALRAAVLSLLIRRPADHGPPVGVRVDLTVSAALDSLTGSSAASGTVDGHLITAAHLRELLARAGALGLEAPDGGSLTFALTDAEGDAQRRWVKTRDRTCRFPHCGQRVGLPDLDHVRAHAAGGETSCTNLCCLCRSHHRLKTFAPGWRFAIGDDGTLHVTTPSGVTRTTRPPGVRPRERAPGPFPGEPNPPMPDDEPPPF